jgi:hypothetical protein
VLLAAVKAGDIFEVVWVSLLAAAVVSAAYSFVVLGLARSADAARRGRGAVAIAYASFALLAFAVFAATVVLGVNIMLNKG